MFFRATERSEGAGLGLYIVKETIEKLGGRIETNSTLGIGTTFIIEIPNQQQL
jgi:signal transduction histidine kinase